VAGVEGTKVRILRAPENEVILKKDGTAIEVANVDDFGIIYWDNAVEHAVLERVDLLLQVQF
jgi:hypothetical protein